MIFDFVFDRHMQINDPMDMYISPHGLKWNVLLQVMNIIILGRLAQFHSDKIFDVSCFNEHKVRPKTWKLGECLTSCTFFRWRRKQISKVVYDWWCYCDDVWKISYEISPWNDRKLMNEKAHVWNIGIAVHRLFYTMGDAMVSENLYMGLFIHWFAVIPKWYFIWKFAHIIDRTLPIITYLRNLFPTSPEEST